MTRRQACQLLFPVVLLSSAVAVVVRAQAPRPAPSPASTHATQGAAGHAMGSEPTTCKEATLRCAIAATPAVGPDGALWLAWAAGGQIAVAKSTDSGRTFGAATLVTPSPVTLDTGADERPQIVVDRQGRITVAFAIFKDAKYNGQILTATSRDDGRTFSTPTPITPDGSSQRFINLQLDADDQVFAAWIDKRRGAAAQQAGVEFDGASLAFAWSHDGGATFDGAQIAHDHMCECCRLGVGLAGPHQPVVLFRNIFAGERDHAVLSFAADGRPGRIQRVAEDHWKIDACPHHGPSLAVGDDGAYHAVWFTSGTARQGAFYARSTDGGRTFSTPMALGPRTSRPYVATLGSRAWIIWKEFDGESTVVKVRSSVDTGVTWDVARTLARTDEFSDHPLLMRFNGRVWLSWFTRTEGYRLLPVEVQS